MHDSSTDLERREMLRQSVMTAVLAVGAGCAIVTLSSRQAAAQKLAKAEAHYQDRPNDQQHCAACAFYLPPVACQVVRGEVSPNGWCDKFQPRAG